MRSRKRRWWHHRRFSVIACVAAEANRYLAFFEPSTDFLSRKQNSTAALSRFCLWYRWGPLESICEGHSHVSGRCPLTFEIIDNEYAYFVLSLVSIGLSLLLLPASDVRNEGSACGRRRSVRMARRFVFWKIISDYCIWYFELRTDFFVRCKIHWDILFVESVIIGVFERTSNPIFQVSEKRFMSFRSLSRAKKHFLPCKKPLSVSLVCCSGVFAAFPVPSPLKLARFLTSQNRNAN